ncbi:MAG TPA: glycosyltransferase family 2 protein [Bryobacteraceae bacterium]|nr:glycosyltransferase family 2 protein [Bryobacteraceae bacterium]
MARIGIVVVTYRSEETIEDCLRSCPSGGRVVVVDNASGDGTCDRVRRFPAVELLANRSNEGFAGAVNQGVAALDTEFVLVLNPDVSLLTPIEALCEAGSDLATGKLVDGSGVFQKGFSFRAFPRPITLIFEVLGINRLWPGNPVNRRYRCVGFDPERGGVVEQPAGAFLLFRREVWRKLGGLDTEFHPIWFEDVDFCKRASDAGYRARYVPEVVAAHRGGESIKNLNWRCREVYWYASLLRYASKHFRRREFRGVSVAVILSSALRGLIGVFRQRSFEAIKVYGRVIRLAVQSMVSGRVQPPDVCPVLSKAVG